MSFLEEVREKLSKVEYPLEFNPIEWETRMEANCYTYALNLEENEGFMIGDFIGKRVTSKDSIGLQIQVLQEEIEALGFYILKCDVEDFVDEDSFKIYIEWNEKNQYHFLRQDIDGIWSHKAGGFLPTRFDKKGFLIMNPETREEHYQGMCFLISKL